MKRSRFASMVVTALLILVAVVCGDEEKVALAKVPKPVMKAVRTRFQDAKVIGTGKETENDKLVYEVTIKHKGRKIDVTLTPEGGILLIEKEIAAKELPKAAAKALVDKYPKAMYKIVEQIFKVENKQEKLAYYEVLLTTADKKALEVQVTAEGKVLNEETKDSVDEDK
jgi:uncharacterized membrane protein YkoI